MAAETNLIKTEDLTAVRNVDFVTQFSKEARKFEELLGVTRSIEAQDGTKLTGYKVVGTLASGEVPEGDVIPLSKYQTEPVDLGTIDLKLWRKATTAKAIRSRGEDQAIGETLDKMVRDVQKKIREDLFAVMATGTGKASGVGLQEALADAWGELQVAWDDDAIDTVYVVNPKDVANYLKTAQVSLQNAFGMKYLQDFLGLGSLLITNGVTQGKFYATAKENLVKYFVNVNNSALGRKFNLTTDDTGLIGINESVDNKTANVENLVMSGVLFFPERIDGIIVGTISAGV